MSAVYPSVAVPAPSRYTAPPTTADVLHRAADLLEEFGWCQGEFGGDVRQRGAMCLLRALNVANCDLGSPGQYRGGMEFLSHVGYTSFFHYNDSPGRTRAEVVAKLREAAEAAR